MDKKWYALFSHTGAEIKNIVDTTRILPEQIWTDNADYDGALNLPWYSRAGLHYGNAQCINHFLESDVAPNSVVTLNGYMRIIPAKTIKACHDKDICILNIHPAPIVQYPELKGKDPQPRLYQGILDGQYRTIGVVIHEVDEGVDTGNVICEYNEYAGNVRSLTDLYQKLHSMGTQMWCTLFEGGLLNGQDS